MGRNRQEISVDPADYETVEDYERLQKAAGELPARYQHAFFRYYFDGRPAAEIAEELKIPERQVELRLHAARKLVRRKLADELH